MLLAARPKAFSQVPPAGAGAPDDLVPPFNPGGFLRGIEQILGENTGFPRDIADLDALEFSPMRGQVTL